MDREYHLFHSFDGKLNPIAGVPEDLPEKMSDAVSNTAEVLEFYMLGLFVRASLEALKTWSTETSRVFGEYLMRDLHIADKLCRDFLFEFRTCLDHMETKIKQRHGKNSQLWQLFKDNTSSAYDNCKEYGFTYHMRNSAQHCTSIVHGFNGSTGVGISCNKNQLLREDDCWKQYDKDYLKTQNDEIDLLSVFQKAYIAFEEATAPVIQYMIQQGNVYQNLWLLRKWGDALSKDFLIDVHYFHIFIAAEQDGDPVSMNGVVPEGTGLKCIAIDWDSIYGITDCMKPKSGRTVTKEHETF